MKRSLQATFGLALLTLFLLRPASAAHGPAYLDAAKAGPDYSCRVNTWARLALKPKWVAQVIRVEMGDSMPSFIPTGCPETVGTGGRGS